jgi:hypothetical protein
MKFVSKQNRNPLFPSFLVVSHESGETLLIQKKRIENPHSNQIHVSISIMRYITDFVIVVVDEEEIHKRIVAEVH